MICPDCGRLRHEGPCEEPYDNEPDFAAPDELEMAQAFHELEAQRLAKRISDEHAR